MALRSLVGTQRSMTDIQGQLLQNNQAEMQNRAARQALQDEQQLRQMAGQGMPLEQLASKLDAVNPRLAMDIRAKLAAQNKVLVDTAKAGADIQKTGWETQNEQLKATQAKLQGRASLLNSIADPKTLALAVEQGRLSGYLDPEEAAQLAQMDPASPEFQAFKQQGMQQVLSQADSINQQLKQLELERTQGTQAGQIAATNAGNRVTVETAQSKVEQAQADAAKAGSAARVALGTEQGQIAAGPNAETGLTAAQQKQFDLDMLTPDIKEWIKAGEPGTLTEWISARANDRKPQTNITVNGPQQTFKNEGDLRGEFNNMPIVKARNEIMGQIQRARGAYQDALKAAQNGGSLNSSDQAIITVLNKVLDPNSVVRESEYARTAEGQAALDRLAGWFTKIKQGGGGISAQQRADLMQTIETVGNAVEQMYRPVEQQYRGLAQSYQLDPNRVVMSQPGAQQQTGRAVVSSQEEYDRIPKGTKYVGPDGVERVKN